MNTIVITGANGNLGAATVKKFLDAGYRVIAADHGNQHLGFAAAHPAFEFHRTDLSNEEATAQFIGGVIEKHRQIHGALLLVGGFAMGGLQATGEAELQKMFSLNFHSAYFAAKPLVAHMSAHGYGRLVFIGARPALQAHAGKDMIAYALSKSLLFKLAEFINASAKGTNLVASVVVPSTIDTEPNRKSMPEANPDNWVKPDAIADILEFICSDKGLPLREPVYKVYNNA